MGLLRGNRDGSKPAAQAGPGHRSAGPGGRDLLLYFLPVVVAALLAMALITWFTLQERDAAQAESARIAARGQAEALAGRTRGFVEARGELLRVVTGLASVHQALQGKDKQVLARTAAAAGELLPGLIQLRLFRPGQIQPDPTGNAPLSFAGVDMLRRVLQGERAPAEIHHINGGNPYLAVARGVMRQGRVVGAVLAAWPIAELKRFVASAQAVAGDWWLVQGGQQGFVIAASGDPAVPRGSENVAVDGGTWQIYYRPAEGGPAEGGWFLWALVGAGVLLVLLVAFFQRGALAGALRADFALLVSLARSIASGQNTQLSLGASVSVSRDAIQSMIDIAGKPPERPAQDSGKRASQPAQAPAKSPPGPQFGETTGVEVEERGEQPPVMAPANIFRAYDIRGVVDRDLTTGVASGLGWAFAEMARAKGVSTVYVAHDARLSSPELHEALCDGLAGGGMRVVELGMGPAALLYFVMHQDADAGAVLVTGSHNPPEYNGFKLYLQTEPVHGAELQELHRRMQQGGGEVRAGSRETLDPRQDYLDAVAQEVSLTRPLRVVVDGGNGAAGELACDLLTTLGCEVTPLFCEPDGHFPNHHPDPSRVENLEALQREVLAREADLGIAFDGDGDRVGMVDDRGEPVRPEHLLMFLAGDILRRHPGSDVIYDVKSSRQLAGFVLAQGGRPIMWRSGHTRMKQKMRETGALLGGEFAGHVYIKERWYGTDDAIYVAVRLLEVIADDTRPLQAQLEELPASPSTPEYRLPLEEGESAGLMHDIAAQLRFPDARIIDLDGLRVEFPQSWGLVRASNTVPSLTFRFEADNEQELDRIRDRFRELVKQVAPDKTLPF